MEGTYNILGPPCADSQALWSKDQRRIDVGLVRGQSGIAGDVMQLREKLAKAGVVQLQNGFGRQARVLDLEVRVIHYNREGEIPFETLLLGIHDGVVGQQRRDNLLMGLGILTASKLPAAS
jgi:hypothetical protein